MKKCKNKSNIYFQNLIEPEKKIFFNKFFLLNYNSLELQKEKNEEKT